jgi:16S rRNA (cytidine1402-2'-O)-methyltransferase
MQGNLYIVATPIGHLGDLSFRAQEILKQVAVIACEDTRHSRKLCQHYGITTKLISYHEHNERDRVQTILTWLKQGKDVALISDAGTPLISDPGYHLVRAVRLASFRVIPIPGASALVAALSASGIASQRFRFEGFLPVKLGDRQKRLQRLSNETITIVFYEAPHRIVNTLSDFTLFFGKAREMVVARELTKIHESISMMTCGEAYEYFQSHPQACRGEFVLLVTGAVAQNISGEDDLRNILTILLEEVPLKIAVKIAARLTHLPKNKIYEIALHLKKM